MIAKVYSAIPYGYTGKLIEVEGDSNRGLPAFNLVGMANKTISEARERVRSAIVSSGFSFPAQKVTINLAPADLQKDGAYFDLPIALAVLILSGQLLQSNIKNSLFVGELSLSGKIRPIRGILNIIETAQKIGIKKVFLPLANLPQASLFNNDIQLFGIDTLQNLFLQLKGELPPKQNYQNPILPTQDNTSLTQVTLLDHIRGQTLAKRAVEIAIAGHHNILIDGPPGSGKTLLAKAAANLLPSLSASEQLSLTKIYSLANLITDKPVNTRPFRNPHHTASTTSIIGGGKNATPGEISLASSGILFLDEIPEFSRSTLEALRQPLEDKNISITRANCKITYPADFMLFATMNPCPCGYLGDPTHECRCSETQINHYQKKLSGPLFDRIDIHVTANHVNNSELLNPAINSSPEHNVVKNNIKEATLRQYARYHKTNFFNSSLSSFEITKFLQLDSKALNLLKNASSQLSLSARSYFKTIKVAQTIADLAKSDIILQEHIAEALTFRKKYR